MAKSMEQSGRSGSPWRIVGWGVAAFLLLLPAVAMQFTPEVNWTVSDFVFAAVMFGTVGLILELTVRRSINPAYRGGVLVALATSFLLIWINGAVGIIGDENEALNLLYIGEIGIALLGSILAMFRARGMAVAMLAAGAAQAGMTAAALILGWGAQEPPGAVGIFGLNAFFCGMWLLSAGLFHKAAKDAGAASGA